MDCSTVNYYRRSVVGSRQATVTSIERVSQDGAHGRGYVYLSAEDAGADDHKTENKNASASFSSCAFGRHHEISGLWLVFFFLPSRHR